MDGPAAVDPSGGTFVRRSYVAVAIAAVSIFSAGALLLALTLPYHDWDAFSLGDWSVALSHGRELDPTSLGPLVAQRPLFYYAQGALWAITGVSFTAGRLLSLCFAALLIAATTAIARQLTHDRPRAGLGVVLAPIVVVAIPTFAQEAIAGKTDVPAAAAVAVVCWLALRPHRAIGGRVALATAAALALLTKPTTILPVACLACVLLVIDRHRLREAVRDTGLPLSAGVLVGLAYLQAAATRLHLTLGHFLSAGTDGIWAGRAASARSDALLGLDVFGGALRLPLAFVLVYGPLRTFGIRHRPAAAVSVVAALVWAVAGPARSAHVNVFEGPLQGFALVGFAALLAVGIAGRDDEAPSRAAASICTVVGLPPLALWAYGSGYATRLGSGAWPALAVLIALVLVPGVRVLARGGAAFALVPVTLLAAAVWFSVSSLDNLHGYEWVEYRSLGASGIWDRDKTMKIVLPSVQSALAVIRPALPADGRLVVGDPSFAYFFSGQVDQTTPLHCSDLDGASVFVLSTSDESEEAARDEGGLATPADWSRCTDPKVRLLSDAVSGYAIFSVS